MFRPGLDVRVSSDDLYVQIDLMKGDTVLAWEKVGAKAPIEVVTHACDIWIQAGLVKERTWKLILADVLMRLSQMRPADDNQDWEGSPSTRKRSGLGLSPIHSELH